jgi:hypothetical protein
MAWGESCGMELCYRAGYGYSAEASREGRGQHSRGYLSCLLSHCRGGLGLAVMS